MNAGISPYLDLLVLDFAVIGFPSLKIASVLDIQRSGIQEML